MLEVISCARCDCVKPTSEFRQRACKRPQYGRRGLSSYCKDCSRAVSLEHWDKSKHKTGTCVDCGESISRAAQRCRPCHRVSRRVARGSQAERGNKVAACLDCGRRCHRSKINQPRCRPCLIASRQTSRGACLECGAPINGRCTRCRKCYFAAVRVPTAKKSKQWKVPAERRLNTSAARRLRAQVLREEPTCQIRVPGVCTDVSTTWDHIVPRAVDPSLTLVRTNVRGACWECNSFIAGRPVSSRPRTVGTCLACDKEFVRWGKYHTYCSKTCGNRGSAVAVYFPDCAVCGTAFCTSNTWRKYCSEDCSREVQARYMRDRYRTQVGLPVDRNRPTKSFARAVESEVTWLVRVSPRRTLARLGAETRLLPSRCSRLTGKCMGLSCLPAMSGLRRR